MMNVNFNFIKLSSAFIEMNKTNWKTTKMNRHKSKLD